MSNTSEPLYDAKQAAQATWTASPAGSVFAPGARPGTKDFFDVVLKKRAEYEQPWLYEVIPFHTFSGKAVLEVGCGAGYDAYEICRNGGDYTGIDLTPSNPWRTRAHLEFYRMTPKVLVGDAEHLMFKELHFDVAFSNGVLHHTPDMARSFREINRVLKAGGEFWVIVYHSISLFYFKVWLRHILTGDFLRRPISDRRSEIEYTASGARPLVNVYSVSELTHILNDTGFTVEYTAVRKLVREDLPLRSKIGWNWVPASWLEAAGRLVGWYVIAKARKIGL